MSPARPVVSCRKRKIQFYNRGRKVNPEKSFARSCIAFLTVAAVLLGATALAGDSGYAQGPIYTYGSYDAQNPGAGAMVPDTPTLAFSGLTLNDVKDLTFRGYFCGGRINSPAYALGTYLSVHLDANGDADKIVMQFAMFDEAEASSGIRYTKALVV